MSGIGLSIPSAALLRVPRRRIPEEASALIRRMSVEPSPAQIGLIANLVQSLVTGGIWGQLDALHVLAAHDAQAARLNWVADQYNLTAVNSPAFTAFRGYAGNGSSACLVSTANPFTLHSSPAAKLKQNAAHMALWRLTSGFTATKGLMGCREAATRFFDMVQFGATSITARPNGGPAHGALTVPAAPGFLAMSRETATSAAYYWNGPPLATLAEASVLPPNAAIAVLAQNVTGEGPSAFANDQIAVVSYGGALTPSQAAAFYAAVRTYLLAVGVVS